MFTRSALIGALLIGLAGLPTVASADEPTTKSKTTTKGKTTAGKAKTPVKGKTATGQTKTKRKLKRRTATAATPAEAASAKDALKETNKLLAQARAQVKATQKGQEAFRQAVVNQKAARAALKKNKADVAMHLTTQARASANLAIAEATGVAAPAAAPPAPAAPVAAAAAAAPVAAAVAADEAADEVEEVDEVADDAQAFVDEADKTTATADKVADEPEVEDM
ncbi:MAG: hypothetical protein H6703_04635 [Myxococcales bacterium]|nr:hypothetical protein [Myxococcales bacterium]